MKAFTFLFCMVSTVPLVGFLIYPADPLKGFGKLTEAAIILAVSSYAGLMALVGLWLSTRRKWGSLRGGASIGVFVALALFPLYFLVLFLGGPVVLILLALLGKLHGMALKGFYGVNLKA